jgi:hypothetical protein
MERTYTWSDRDATRRADRSDLARLKRILETPSG